MPQTPTSSPLFQLWASHLQKQVLSDTFGCPVSWPAEICCLHGHTHQVNSVAYSPDGNQIVSGSWDKTIRVWTATTGQCVEGAFQGHIHFVTSVAYSPNGTHIVSVSLDQSIKVWNTEALLLLGDLSQEHGWILSSNNSCYGWFSPWSLPAFHLPVHSLVISSNNHYKPNTDFSLFGESWISCWK